MLHCQHIMSLPATSDEVATESGTNEEVAIETGGVGLENLS